MRYLFTIFLLAALTSCKTLLLKSMIKDPAVENTASIRSFQESNHFSTENSLISKGDSGSVEENVLRSFEGYHIFDTDGHLISYAGSATCTGTQFYQLMAGDKDSFRVVANDSITLQKVLSHSYDLNEQPVSITNFPKADYFVVAYWTKFLGGRRGYNDQVVWMEDIIRKDTGVNRFSFIKINTDMQENWGLLPGKKAAIKFRRKGNGLSLSVENIPVRKQ